MIEFDFPTPWQHYLYLRLVQLYFNFPYSADITFIKSPLFDIRYYSLVFTVVLNIHGLK